MNKKAQITLEVCVLIVIVLVGLLAAQVYLRRAIQGNWRTNADSFSDEQYSVGASTEYYIGGVEDTFKGSYFNASELGAGQLQGPINVASGTGNLRITGWGTYED